MTDTKTNENTGSKAPTHIAYQVRDREGKKGFWTRIGSVWPHADGKGFNIQLEVVPLEVRPEVGFLALRGPTELTRERLIKDRVVVEGHIEHGLVPVRAPLFDRADKQNLVGYSSDLGHSIETASPEQVLQVQSEGNEIPRLGASALAHVVEGGLQC